MDCLNSSPLCRSRSVLSASSFEDSNNFFAALAVLLGRFFAFAIDVFNFPIYDLVLTAERVVRHNYKTSSPSLVLWIEP